MSLKEFAKSPLLWILTVTLFLLAFRMNVPSTLVFDETHYVPAAKSFLELESPKNIEHPPLSKILNAIGIGVLGDTPFGWRSIPLILVVFAMLLIYKISNQLIKGPEFAPYAALLVLSNFVFYVQFRLAMPEASMIFFMFLSLYYFLKFLQNDSFFHLTIFSAAFGFAVASKWTSVLLFFPLLITFIFHSYWKHLRAKKIIATLGLGVFMSLSSYYLCFLPYLLFRSGAPKFFELFYTFQHEMFNLQKSVGGAHPYSSQFWQWLLSTRPIWYSYLPLKDDPSLVNGIFFMLNPLTNFIGLFFVIPLGITAMKEKNVQYLLLTTGFLVFAFIWPLIPRQLSFYYYYFPATFFLTLILGVGIHRFLYRIRFLALGLHVAFFLYFLPILGSFNIKANSLGLWMWLRSWI